MGRQTANRISRTSSRLLLSALVSIAVGGGCLASIAIGILVAGLGMNPWAARALDFVASFPGEFLCGLTGTADRFRYVWTATFWGLVAGGGWAIRHHRQQQPDRG